MVTTDFDTQEQQAVNQLQRNVIRQVHATMNSLSIYFWQPRQEPRYLVWLQWSRIKRVPLETIVREVVCHYRTVCRKSGSGLGLMIKSITGDKAWQWVEENVAAGSISDSQVSADSLHQIRNTTSLDTYIETVNQIRRGKTRRVSQKPYRGTKPWSQPRRSLATVDVVLSEFGYNSLRPNGF